MLSKGLQVIPTAWINIEFCGNEKFENWGKANFFTQKCKAPNFLFVVLLIKNVKFIKLLYYFSFSKNLMDHSL